MPSAVPIGTFRSATKPTTRATIRAHSCRCSKPQPAMKPAAAFARINHPTKVIRGRSQTVTSGGGPLGIWLTRPKIVCATMITTTPATTCNAEYAIQRMPTVGHARERGYAEARRVPAPFCRSVRSVNRPIATGHHIDRKTSLVRQWLDRFCPVGDTDRSTQQLQENSSQLPVVSSQFSVNNGPVASRLRTENCLQTKRPPGNLGGLFFQGRIVPTEVSIHQSFLRESYEPQKRSVKQNFRLK